MADAQLCGSVNLESAADVFDAVSDLNRANVRRVPDGETGPRQQWIMAQIERFAANPDFEVPDDFGFAYASRPVVRLRDGVDAADATLDLGYAAAAVEHYPLFARMRDEGRFAADTRFQVSLPTLMAIVSVYIDPAQQDVIAPVVERALAAEIAAILRTVPAEDLAIQWDVAVEIVGLESGNPGRPPLDEAVVVGQIVRMGALVPEPVQLGYHLCYGDAPEQAGGNGRHLVQPQDTALLVRVANAIVDGVDRPVDWIHMPVPIERADDAYYAPLDGLRLPDVTRLYLGLVHWQDGVDGTQRRIDAAARHVRGFGVATECGMGRRPREAVRTLLEIQRDAVVPA